MWCSHSSLRIEACTLSLPCVVVFCSLDGVAGLLARDPLQLLLYRSVTPPLLQ